MPDMNDLLEKLLTRTDDRAVAWETTSVVDVFVAVIGPNSVRLSTVGDNEYTRLQVLNSEGRVLDSLEVTQRSSAEFDAPLNRLLETARRLALGTDEVIDEILLDLDF